jgi:hypothetical protein
MVKFINDTAPKSKPRLKKQTEAQIDAANELKEARAGADARRLETRRKVIVGAALMVMAKTDPDAARILDHIKRSQVRPSERKLFEV